MTSDLDKLLKFLEVERIDKYLFIGRSPKRPPRVFGGQVRAHHAARSPGALDQSDHAGRAFSALEWLAPRERELGAYLAAPAAADG